MRLTKIYEVLRNLKMNTIIRIIDDIEDVILYDDLVSGVPFGLEEEFCYDSLFYDSARQVLIMYVRKKKSDND